MFDTLIARSHVVEYLSRRPTRINLFEYSIISEPCFDRPWWCTQFFIIESHFQLQSRRAFVGLLCIVTTRSWKPYTINPMNRKVLGFEADLQRLTHSEKFWWIPATSRAELNESAVTAHMHVSKSSRSTSSHKQILPLHEEADSGRALVLLAITVLNWSVYKDHLHIGDSLLKWLAKACHYMILKNEWYTFAHYLTLHVCYMGPSLCW